MNNMEEDIKRCKKLTEPQNASWIGISNQLAIAHLIERIKELEETDLTTVYMKGYVDAEEKYRKKVKNKMKAIKQKAMSYGHLIDRDEAFKVENEINVLEELLEEKE